MTAPLSVFFTDSLHLVFRSYIDENQKGDYRLLHPAARQCRYCDNYFTCSKNEFLKYVKKCTSIEGIIYKCENNKIISFQDNFKHLGDVPFTICFDFKITTGIMFFTIQKCLSSAIVKFTHFIRA